MVARWSPKPVERVQILHRLPKTTIDIVLNVAYNSKCNKLKGKGARVDKANYKDKRLGLSCNNRVCYNRGMTKQYNRCLSSLKRSHKQLISVA